ncbi:MAG: CvpA family protein [Bacteroides sp.]|nr:CvpA family protein [Bacteroides sp.]MCM1389487.1 CvpA family protein [Bacteroides sp.]
MDLDIILCVIAGVAFIYGLYKGFIAQLASIGGLILGIIACRLFHQQVGELVTSLFPDTFTSPGVAMATGCIVLFIIVYFFISAFARLLRHITHALCVGWLDRLLGGVASAFKLLLLCSIILNIWHFIAPESPIFTISKMLMDGKPFNAVMELAPKIFGIVSEQITMPDC